jgi:hypothetical protein
LHLSGLVAGATEREGSSVNDAGERYYAVSVRGLSAGKAPGNVLEPVLLLSSPSLLPAPLPPSHHLPKSLHRSLTPDPHRFSNCHLSLLPAFSTLPQILVSASLLPQLQVSQHPQALLDCFSLPHLSASQRTALASRLQPPGIRARPLVFSTIPIVIEPHRPHPPKTRTMAPPPSADLPLQQRLIQLAQTLQCMSSLSHDRSLVDRTPVATS